MPGSHRCGRIDHGPIGGQQGANLERVELLKTRFPTIPVILNSGNKIFQYLLSVKQNIFSMNILMFCLLLKLIY